MRHLYFVLLLPALAGCLVPIPFGYPTWSQTRPVFLTKEEDTVRAFRLDLKQEFSCPEFNHGNDCLWSEIGRWPFAVIPGQTEVNASYGFRWNCIALVYHKHVFRKVVVRLYRPGFETVELTYWNGAKAIEWKAAPTLEAQERAVDDLLEFEPGRLISGRKDTDWKFLHIPPGSRSRDHRHTLLFAATEFERLSEMPCSNETKQRLAEKSRWLRQRAEE